MKDEITFTKKEVLKLYETLSHGMGVLGRFAELSLIPKPNYDSDKLHEFNKTLEVDGRLGEIENYLYSLFLKDPGLFDERFESWLEKERKSKKLAEMGKKK